MMHGHEKSDSAIVAKKLPNKAGQPAAEAVERRAGTKGNTGQQSTRQTQIRESVSQALERVRKAARQRKKEKFTALLHHISTETLEVAFYALKRRAAPGVDGVTWQEYEADLERRLIDLHGRIHRGAYRPQPSRRTYIPKADGRLRRKAIEERKLKRRFSRKTSGTLVSSCREGVTTARLLSRDIPAGWPYDRNRPRQKAFVNQR